jgi:hypothetical protein
MKLKRAVLCLPALLLSSCIPSLGQLGSRLSAQDVFNEGQFWKMEVAYSTPPRFEAYGDIRLKLKETGTQDGSSAFRDSRNLGGDLYSNDAGSALLVLPTPVALQRLGKSLYCQFSNLTRNASNVYLGTLSTGELDTLHPLERSKMYDTLGSCRMTLKS